MSKVEGYIYKITNILNNKIYIGQTKRTIEVRWKGHLTSAFNSSQNSYNYPLYKDIRKYGIENFKISIIEKCPINLLDEKEKYWISYYNSKNNGYNQTVGGNSVQLYDYNEIYRLWEKGYSCKEIKELTEISYTTLAEILNKFNIDSEDRIKRSNDKKVYINKEIIINDFINGLSINKIAKKHKISFKWVKNTLLEHGFNEKDFEENAKNNHSTSGSPKSISQYDLNKNFIQSFSSIKNAKLSLNKLFTNTGLNHALKHDNDFHLYDGYYWRYNDAI